MRNGVLNVDNKFTPWPLSKAATREPAPTGNGPVVLPFVLEIVHTLGQVAGTCGLGARAEYLHEVYCDLKARAEFGKGKYGTYLRASNGRDCLNDLEQENYDAIMYSGQLRMEGDLEGSKYLETYIEMAVHYRLVREQRETSKRA